MRNQLICALVFVFCTTPTFAKTFERALVLSGGGADWPVFTGAFQGLVQSGENPDLIVGVCGGSIASAMIYAHPDADFSDPESVRDAFEVGAKVGIQNHLLVSYLGFLTSYKKLIQRDTVGSLLSPTILKLPDFNALPSFNEKFSSTKKRRLIILATKILYDPFVVERNQKMLRQEADNDDIERPSRPARMGRKLFRLTIFTDPVTARALKKLDLVSKPARLFPESAMDDKVDIVDDATIGDAVRASISDPLLVRPAKVGNFYYMTGATDNYPVEMVSRFADKITHTLWQPLPKWQKEIFESVFKFDSNKMIELTDRTLVDHWVFLGADATSKKSLTMNPKVSKVLTLQSGFPKTFERFSDDYSSLYDFGLHRAVQSFKKSESSSRPEPR